MLSFGIEYERAFSIAFWSARFPAGSGPPSLAATMIARESLEKSWPRFASAAPFLCLMLDHLLCPDTDFLSLGLLDHRQEQLVDAQVVGQLGMEGREQEPPVADEHGLAVERSDDGHGVAERADPRCTDEDAAERNLVGRELDVGLEALHLPAERIPVHDEIRKVEVLAIDHDHPGAGAEHSAG